MSQFFTDTVTVKRYSTTSVGSGGEVVKTWSSQFDITGSFQQLSGDKRIDNAQNAFRKTHILYCPVADIRDKDLIVYNSKEYEITDVANQFNHHLEVTMRIRSTS